MEEQQPGAEISRNAQDQNLPELYSKRLILIFSMLFSVIFAAVLLVLNLRRLGKKKAAGYVLIFAIIFLFLSAILLQVLGLDPAYSFVFNVLGAGILNEYFWNKYIGAETGYSKRSWVKPTMAALLIALLFFFILMELGVQKL